MILDAKHTEKELCQNHPSTTQLCMGLNYPAMAPLPLGKRRAREECQAIPAAWNMPGETISLSINSTHNINMRTSMTGVGASLWFSW